MSHAYLGHIYIKNYLLFILNLNLTGQLVFLFAKFGHPIRGSQNSDGKALSTGETWSGIETMPLYCLSNLTLYADILIRTLSPLRDAVLCGD